MKHTVNVGNDAMRLHAYLDSVDSRILLSRLSMSERMRLHLMGYVRLVGVVYNKIQVYLCQSDRGYYLSYPQSHRQLFYAPEYWKGME